MRINISNKRLFKKDFRNIYLNTFFPFALLIMSYRLKNSVKVHKPKDTQLLQSVCINSCYTKLVFFFVFLERFHLKNFKSIALKFFHFRTLLLIEYFSSVNDHDSNLKNCL